MTAGSEWGFASTLEMTGMAGVFTSVVESASASAPADRNVAAPSRRNGAQRGGDGRGGAAAVDADNSERRR